LERQSAQYVAGYIVNRFSHKYLELISSSEKDNLQNSWINLKTKGGLKIPSENVVNAIVIMEKYFNDLNGDSLATISGVMKHLSNIIKPHISHLNIPNDVLECLVRTRAFI